MAEGHRESKRKQLLYATRTLSPIRLVLKVTRYTFLFLYVTGVFLCIWEVLSINWTKPEARAGIYYICPFRRRVMCELGIALRDEVRNIIIINKGMDC